MLKVNITDRHLNVLVIILSTWNFATTRRQQDDDDEDKSINLDNLYSFEDEDDPKSRFVSLKGELRQTFALAAAIDKNNQNMVCSPLSALLPLGKLAIGAKDEALDELLLTIGISRKRKLKSHFKSIIENLKYMHGVKLDIASRIYLSKNLDLYKKFLDRSKYIFDSTAEKIDFSSPNDAAYSINIWVSRQTNGMIQDLILPTQIPASSALLLVNAIYFAGQWKEPFDKIYSGTFYTPSGGKQVTMMSKLSWFNYARSNNLGAQLIEIPYAGDEASFVILLPFKKEGLPALLSQLKLAPELLNNELSKMRKLKIMLTMPKFKMETKLDLVDLYKKVRLNNIFQTQNSGLKKIVQGESVFVSNAVQKVVIEVTELGTEGAASSALAIIPLELIENEKFEANHPFLFYVISQRQQLFAGALVNP